MLYCTKYTQSAILLKKAPKLFQFKQYYNFYFIPCGNKRKITRIFDTYSITESITVSRNCLLLSERVCQDPTLALLSFTFFEEPFSSVNTKEKRKRYHLSNLDKQLCESIQSHRSQRCNSYDYPHPQTTVSHLFPLDVGTICKSQVV